ncbi:MAG: aldo/keto reductase [Bacteroidaceae bacterium]|nr:aldo/keto reductase [Bacteroidaceae bacterium]
MKKILFTLFTILCVTTMNAQHNQTYLTLNNGVQMPQFGLGVYSIPAGDMTYNSVLTALQSGYRHIDTAHAYQNEANVGQAIRESGIARDSIWVTSKLWPNEYGEGKTLKAIDRMLGRLGLDYVDLVYFHQPIGDYVGGWKEMEKALETGKVRAIGISNFDVNDSIWNSLVETARIKPQIVQIECHPYAQRKHWQEMAKKHDIKIECWFPLGGRDSKGEILRDPVINQIAQAHGMTAAQVIIRWHLQEGFSVIPGSTNPAHIRENIGAFDFALTDAEMQQIRSLDREARYFNMSYEDQKRWFGQWNPTD